MATIDPRVVVTWNHHRHMVNGRQYRSYSEALEQFMALVINAGYDPDTAETDKLAIVGTSPVYVIVGAARCGGVWVNVTGQQPQQIAFFDSLQDAREWISDTAYVRFIAHAEWCFDQFQRMEGESFRVAESLEKAGRAHWIKRRTRRTRKSREEK